MVEGAQKKKTNTVRVAIGFLLYKKPVLWALLAPSL